MSEQPSRLGRRDTRLLYALAVVITTSQGSLELTLPLNLHALGYSLPLVGTAVAALGLGQILSRIPGGAWYRLDRGRPLTTAALAAFSLTTMGLGLTGSWDLQAVLAAGHGFAFGLVTTFMLAILIDLRQDQRRPVATMAWYTASISAGYAIGAPLGALAIARFGYSPSFWISGGVGLLATALSLALALDAAALRPQPARERRRWGGTAVAALLALPASIWLATLLVFYINFVSDLLGAFFPIYAVGIGIPLALVGLLKSVNSLAATGIRFGSAGLFRYLDPAPINHGAVVAMALAMVGVSLFSGQLWLLAMFALLGICRGLIRVTTATAVAEGRSHPRNSAGMSSGVYNAGLDAGSMLAPPLGGALAALVGIPATFRLAAVALPALYYLAWFLLRIRRPPTSEPGTVPATRAE